MDTNKSFLIDTTRCTACRGCQVACKQWHDLPATETTNFGSHQNPQDLNFHTYKLVRFNEVGDADNLRWLFFPDQCRHCLEAPCEMVMDDPEAIYTDPTIGAVLFTDKTARWEYEDPLELCPYNIPRRDPASGIWSKCDMCYDRVKNGLKPACVQVCPTGTMQFGDRDEIMELANERLSAVRKSGYDGALLADADQVRTIFLLGYDPAEYYTYAVADASGRGLNRQQMFAKLFRRPMRVLG